VPNGEYDAVDDWLCVGFLKTLVFTVQTINENPSTTVITTTLATPSSCSQRATKSLPPNELERGGEFCVASRPRNFLKEAQHDSLHSWLRKLSLNRFMEAGHSFSVA
ncbi:hypothetical protein AVEN_234598-1, partial [Araneus ventricosus]